jgi:hypothetical protein
VRDEGRKSGTKPFWIGLAKWNERAPAAFHEEHCFATEQDDPRAGDARGAGARASRPGNRCTVRLRWIGGCEDECVSLGSTQIRRTQLAETLDGARERELRSSKPFDEVSAPAETERLEHSKLRVDRAVAAADALAAHAVARDDSLAFEQELGERPAIRTLWL